MSIAHAALAVLLALTPFQVVDGDGWLTSNAAYTGGWSVLDAQRPAFGLQLSERNDLPFDRGTAGATFWVHNAGCATFESFDEPCGWQLGLALTQFRSIVVGGQGIEIDGLGAPRPYARIVNSVDEQARLAGLLTNTYVDFSGTDEAAAPSWFGGFDLTQDGFAVRRAPAGTRHFEDLLALDRNGNGTFASSVAAPQARQTAPNQWATRARLSAGRFTFRYAKPFAQLPVCVATPESPSHLYVTPERDRCVVTSENPRDTATIDVVVVGNPG
jgi:hypothetical protein